MKRKWTYKNIFENGVSVGRPHHWTNILIKLWAHVVILQHIQMEF